MVKAPTPTQFIGGKFGNEHPDELQNVSKFEHTQGAEYCVWGVYEYYANKAVTAA